MGKNLETIWDNDSYAQATKEGNPALGQCYPTSRVVQHFFPQTEIIKGEIWNGKKNEIHFWNGLLINDTLYHIDLTWQQFPTGSIVKGFKVLKQDSLNDSEATIICKCSHL